MKTYIILSRFSPDTFKDPKDLREKAHVVSEKIKSECKGVVWKESYVMMGRYDVIDIVEADDPTVVEKAAMIIRGYGACSTETMPATPWKKFLETL
jgi:uncharacterized protein with GYD domain